MRVVVAIFLLALLFAVRSVEAQNLSTKPENVVAWSVDHAGEPSAEELMNSVAELARERKIPLMQVAYRSPDRYFAFEHSTLDEITPDASTQTIFQAASISKALFAYIVMRLVDRGVLNLDKPLYKYTRKVDSRFCNAFESKAENKENIRRAKMLTARIVLNHRTGLPNWAKGEGSRASLPLAFKYEPGEKYTYSGEGIWYLQRVVEHITGKSLEQLAREEVFEPFGMVNSSYIWLSRYDDMAAYGYDTKGVRRGRGIRRTDNTAGNAAYTLRTNVLDMSRFLEHLMVGDGLKPQTFKEMITSLQPTSKGKDTYFGLGILVNPSCENPKNEMWHHTGANPNFRCRFLLFPQRQSYLVYFSNSNHGSGKTHDQMLEIFYPNR